ncbi:MAG: hypothetical protein VX278_22420 [Myxococcota bacterium]|nr:hypothetical protein [Myxococcota bacterium]
MGRTTAERTIQALNALKNDDTTLLNEEGLIFSQPIDPTQQHWIGLGEGGRAILELLSQEDIQSNLPQSIIFDSSPLDLQPYLETPEAFPVESGTLNKVFVGEEGYPLSDLSLWSWQNVSFPSRVALIWSNGDSKMPQNAFQNAVSNLNVAEFWTEDINRSGHVFVNSDLTLAQRTVQFMISGDPTIPEEPSEPAQEPSSETEDTGSAETEDTGTAENEEAQE